MTYDPALLPAVVPAYLTAHVDHDYAVAAAAFTEDAVVVDDGRTYTGLAEIRPWLERSSTEWTYTTTPTGQTVLDDTRVDVTVHLAGDFPGGQVDLHYRFTLDGDRIAALTIEV